MKNLRFAAVLAVAVVAAVVGRAFAGERGHNEGIALEDLAGQFSSTGQGTIYACVSTTAPFPPAKCGSNGSVAVPTTILQIGVAARDEDGNSCSTVTQVFSNLPLDVTPPLVLQAINVNKTVSYDPATGTGDLSGTGYSGGKCVGAAFDSTGATATINFTSHFAASGGGKRVDLVTTSLTNPVGSIGDFSISATQFRQ